MSRRVRLPDHKPVVGKMLLCMAGAGFLLWVVIGTVVCKLLGIF